jgi:two-component system, OmpR family, sensor kinase
MARRLRRALAARSQLRMRVMAGVVAVTLAALAAFDVTAVTTMRHYLYGQARSELTAAIPDWGDLQVLIQSGYSLPGQYYIIWLPTGGKPRAIQFPEGNLEDPNAPALPTVANVIARAATKPGFHPVTVAGQLTLVDRINDPGGWVVTGTSLAPVTNTLVQIERMVVIGSAVVLLLIGAGIFLVLRRGLRPIESMAAQADRITAGDLADRVAPHNPRSEVGRLGAALNGMLTRIEATVQQRAASQEQMRQFFADASHELRTPLASLLANAELHQHGALTEPAQITEVMRRMALESQRMGRLVDDMLRLARLGQHPGQGRELFDLTALVAGCAERVRITDPGRRWQVDIADGLEMTGDEELLRRAVDNLCANVLVHTPSDTAATIAVTAGDGRVRIEVSDDGPGVAAGKLPHIFERFYRAGAGASRPGSGLGLAIVAEVAAAHGGTAEAAPASPHGLRITLTLPVEQPAPSPPRLDNGARQILLLSVSCGVKPRFVQDERLFSFERTVALTYQPRRMTRGPATRPAAARRRRWLPRRGSRRGGSAGRGRRSSPGGGRPGSRSPRPAGPGSRPGRPRGLRG